MSSVGSQIDRAAPIVEVQGLSIGFAGANGGKPIVVDSI